MKRSSSRYTTTSKRDKIPQKSPLVHIVELSTAVVAVDTKVSNASLTHNQCLQRVTPPLMHVEISRPSDATEQNNDGVIKLCDIHYQNRSIFINFSERDLINDVSVSSFCSHILLAIDLQCHVFPVEKLLLNVRLCL